MEIFGIGGGTLAIAQKSLNMISRSTALTSSNIANAETPGYKGKHIDFESVMRKTLDSDMTRTNPKHFPLSDINALESKTINNNNSPRLDGNDVRLDDEISRLAENNIKYSTYTAIANEEIRDIKSAISLRVR